TVNTAVAIDDSPALVDVHARRPDVMVDAADGAHHRERLRGRSLESSDTGADAFLGKNSQHAANAVAIEGAPAPVNRGAPMTERIRVVPQHAPIVGIGSVLDLDLDVEAIEPPALAPQLRPSVESTRRSGRQLAQRGRGQPRRVGHDMAR